MTQKQNIELKAGRLVMFSSGEYSDYQVRGTYVALRDVSEAEMQEIAEAARSKAADPAYQTTHNAQSLFEPELIKRGCLLVVDTQEIYIGGYGELDLS